MWHWFSANWGWLLLGMLLASYFALYVLAIRHQRAGNADGKPRLPCDRC